MWAVKVDGVAITKGDLVCFGGKGGRHKLSEKDKPGGKEWRARVTAAGQALLGAIGERLEGPVSMEITFTLELGKSIDPATRLWPHLFGTGDIDKLTRMILDAFTDSGIWKDDAQVVELALRKAYPHTPAPDLLEQSGAFIRIWRTET